MCVKDDILSYYVVSDLREKKAYMPTPNNSDKVKKERRCLSKFSKKTCEKKQYSKDFFF